MDKTNNNASKLNTNAITFLKDFNVLNIGKITILDILQSKNVLEIIFKTKKKCTIIHSLLSVNKMASILADYSIKSSKTTLSDPSPCPCNPVYCSGTGCNGSCNGLLQLCCTGNCNDQSKIGPKYSAAYKAARTNKAATVSVPVDKQRTYKLRVAGSFLSESD